MDPCESVCDHVCTKRSATEPECLVPRDPIEITAGSDAGDQLENSPLGVREAKTAGESRVEVGGAYQSCPRDRVEDGPGQ